MNVHVDSISRTVDPTFYVSEEIFKLEKAHLLPYQLFFAGHSSEFALSGQFRKLTLLGDDILICGLEDGKVKAMNFNVPITLGAME